MKVWVLAWTDYSTHGVVGVYSDLSVAREVYKQLNSYTKERVYLLVEREVVDGRASDSTV